MKSTTSNLTSIAQVYKNVMNLYRKVEHLAPKLAYHNKEHIYDVTVTAMKYGLREKLSYENIYLLGTAGVLHDIVYVNGRTDNEERSAEFAQSILPHLGYSSEQIQTISDLILATKIPTFPKNKLEMILCDSDIDNIGRDDFFDKAELLRKEWGYDKDKWYKEFEPNFLKNVCFYTDSAKALRNSQLKKNINQLEVYK